MRILFGVQGTGNGHISRAREILRYLPTYADVDILVSGTQYNVDLGFEIRYKLSGLAFVLGKNGGIDYWNSVKDARLYNLINDIAKLPVEKYDLIISDFEPITAWASKLKGAKSVTLSHQASFLSPKTPRPDKKNYPVELIMRWYAPCSIPIGFHFERYDTFIHTPVIRQEIREANVRNNGHYTVYIPFYGDDFLIKYLSKVDVKWEVFSNHYKGNPYTQGNVTIYPVSNDGFVKSVTSCEGLLSGAGFETPAEALFLGKKLMVIPMRGQYEQECNAEALQRLGVPVVKALDMNFDKILRDWIDSSNVYHADYQNHLPSIIEYMLEIPKERKTF
ncbi:MAG TPA: glycosyltransferase family protein [Thermodesulfobacteriota bacterium]|nr:glycosyltransferase family protein [Thermodesulfobacteriota bacterium]